MDEAALPEWSPNHNVGYLAGVVPAELLLAQRDGAAIVARRIDAYPRGWELEVVWISPGDRPSRGEPAPWPTIGGLAGNEPPDSMVRVEITYPDGRIARDWHYLPELPVPELMMLPLNGGGFAFRGIRRYWVWPLPPPGDITFTTWWPVRHIEAAQTTLSADLVLDAARRSREILPSSDPERA